MEYSDGVSMLRQYFLPQLIFTRIYIILHFSTVTYELVYSIFSKVISFTHISKLLPAISVIIGAMGMNGKDSRLIEIVMDIFN